MHLLLIHYMISIDCRKSTLGWGLGKKRLPIDSGIMGAYADIYRRLLDQKNPGACFMKYWARGIFVLLYCNCYNDSTMTQLQMEISENFPCGL